MKTSLAICLFLILSIRMYAQKGTNDSLAGFDNVHFQEHLSEIKDKVGRENFTRNAERNFIRTKYYPAPARTFPLSASSSTCGNFDFEDGNANGWTIGGDFQIMSGSGIDPFGGFPVVCPGGNFSLRLNDNNTNAGTCSPPGSKTTFTASASRTIAITAANAIINVNYAGVILNFPHPQNAAANFRIEFYDQFNNPITAPTSYTACWANPPGGVVANMPTSSGTSTVQGLQICSYGQYPTAYFPWQTQTFNFSAFIGSNITIKLSADWCLYQYDWGYAYFDVCCDNTNCNKIAVLNVDENEKETLKIYPNPAKNILNIDCGKLKTPMLVVYNCLGQEVMRRNLSANKNQIQLDDLSDGLYLFSIYSQNKQVKQGKLVKE